MVIVTDEFYLNIEGTITSIYNENKIRTKTETKIIKRRMLLSPITETQEVDDSSYIVNIKWINSKGKEEIWGYSFGKYEMRNKAFKQILDCVRSQSPNDPYIGQFLEDALLKEKPDDPSTK